MEDDKAKFEALSNWLRGLSDPFKLSCFLSGVKDEVRLSVRMFNPSNLIIAYSLAKLQEENLHITKIHPKPSLFYTAELGLLKNPQRTEKPSHFPNNKPKSNEGKQGERVLLALWNPSHKCQKPKLYLLVEIFSDLERENVHESAAPEKEIEGELVELAVAKETPENSLHALIGVP